MYNGFVKVAAITPDLEVGNPLYNVKEMVKILKNINADFAVFPELATTGYTCGDLFFESILLNDNLEALKYLLKNNPFKGLLLVGSPIEVEGSLYNTALVIQGNKILGIVPKRSLPNSNEFYEKRWFKSAKNTKITSINFLDENIPFGSLMFEDNTHLIRFCVEICEDMWAPIAPSNILAYHGANMTFNLSSSNETLGKAKIRKTTVLESSRRNVGAYIYATAGVNESTSETVFSGHNIIACCGEMLVETENFSSSSAVIYADVDMEAINFNRRKNTNLHDGIGYSIAYQLINFTTYQTKDYNFFTPLDETPFVPKKDILVAFNKIASLQEFALVKRLKHTNAKTLLIGVSGGLDSTLALLVAVEAFKKLGKDLKDIIAVTMPGFGTSSRTKKNALEMMRKLGVAVKEISIKEEALLHFEMIGQDKDNHDITYENTQARIRTMVLMNLANKLNGLVLGTGDMSELALGWCTYNGDQMSNYCINAGIPKTLVRFMIHEYANTKFIEIKDTLEDIIDTPISPELSGSDQKTEDAVGKYEVNDFILYRYLTCGDDEKRIVYLLEKAFKMTSEEASTFVSKFFYRFFTQQFKRQALPDGPKILDVSLSPRSDYRMPSDIKRW